MKHEKQELSLNFHNLDQRQPNLGDIGYIGYAQFNAAGTVEPQVATLQPIDREYRAPSVQEQNFWIIEQRSIDYVPIAARHGKVWHLWPVWFTGDAHLATMATGFVGVALGGNLAWTAIAVLVGCAFGTFFMAFHSTKGPQLGLPQMIQSRPQFGYRRRAAGLGGRAGHRRGLQRLQPGAGRAGPAPLAGGTARSAPWCRVRGARRGTGGRRL